MEQANGKLTKNNHLQLGKIGEGIACQFLKEKGYQILEKNYRFSRAEIDIITLQGEVLVFVEVKTRSYDGLGFPEEFVDEYKEQLLMEAAAAYMDQVCHDWEIRFDIVSIVYQDRGNYRINHIEDAFFPGLKN